MKLNHVRPDLTADSAKSARNPRLGEAGRNGGKDGEMRGIRQNRKPHIIKYQFLFCLYHE